MSLVQRTVPLALLALLACFPLHRRQTAPPPPPAPRTDRATLLASKGLDLYVHSVDGHRAFPGDKDRLELEPGIHTLTLKFSRTKTPAGRPIPHATAFDLAIDAQVGRTYQIEYSRSEATGAWTAWVVEGADKRRVSSVATSDD